MSKSNKIIISLSVVAFIMLSVLVSVVVVFAEETQPIISRNITAIYNVLDADCSLSATYKLGDISSNEYYGNKIFTIDGNESSANTVAFVSGDNKQTQNLLPQSDIVFTENRNSAIINFKLANLGLNDFSATLIVDGDNSKFNVEYSQDGITWGENVRFNVSARVGSTATIENYYVRISLIDKTAPVSYSANFMWTIVGVY